MTGFSYSYSYRLTDPGFLAIITTYNPLGHSLVPSYHRKTFVKIYLIDHYFE